MGHITTKESIYKIYEEELPKTLDEVKALSDIQISHYLCLIPYIKGKVSDANEIKQLVNSETLVRKEAIRRSHE